MKVYRVDVTRDGRFWMLNIPELEGVTQARRVSEVRQMAREYIALTADVPMSQVEVDVHYQVPGFDVDRAVGRIDRDRRLEALVARRLATEQRAAAEALVSAEVPMRDVGELLGVSHQRVQQLVTQK